MKPGLRKYSQQMWEEKEQRQVKKSSHKLKMTTIASSQEGQPRGDSQQKESVAHHVKDLPSRSREMSVSYCIYQ